MLPLNVPFLPEHSYPNFLQELGSQVYSVHFSLYSSTLNDARVQMEQIPQAFLIEQLQQLSGPKKYLLANGLIQPKETYTANGRLHQLCGQLEKLIDGGVLDGLIFGDSYLLTILGDTAPSLAGRLEAVPSVNFSIDNPAKLNSLMELIDACGFRRPGKIAVDRSLNRRPDDLAALSEEIRRRWPGVKIELLANEGCLSHCPFRTTHEAFIAVANSVSGADSRIDTHMLNKELACQRHFLENPQRILASPFIRPEDMHSYEGMADLIKLCGRTLGPEFLKKTVHAYTTGRYEGNFLELLDASHWLSERYHLANEQFPQEFLAQLSSCDQDCHTCDYCRRLFECHAQKKQWKLADYRSSGSMK